MESLCDALFEISNEDRLRILIRLDGEPMNVTSISRELDITTQEASRHLSRLGGIGLTLKDPDGNHHITPYGRLVLAQLAGLEFATKNRDYFSTHLHERLPPEFLNRMGELNDSLYVGDAVVSLYSIEKMIRDAEEYIWSINFPIPISVFPLLTEAFGRGVKVRLMAPKDYVVHPLVKGSVQDEDRDAIFKARADWLLEERFTERMDVQLWMSEKEVALIAFPKPNGSFNLLGFTSKDERVREWCMDLFQHYWENAEL